MTKYHTFCANKKCNLWMPVAPNGLCAFCDPAAHGEPPLSKATAAKENNSSKKRRHD